MPSTVNHSLLIPLDQLKAFDRAEHGYLFDVLGVFRFPETSVGLFRALYDSMETHLSLAGTRMASSTVGRGVR